jgi:hypothetical protein
MSRENARITPNQPAVVRRGELRDTAEYPTSGVVGSGN